MRHAHQKDALEKNLLLIGKLAYKLSKSVNLNVLNNIKISKEDPELHLKLFNIYLSLTTVTQAISNGWLDGASFYQFFKKGGIHNLIECFHWLGN